MNEVRITGRLKTFDFKEETMIISVYRNKKSNDKTNYDDILVLINSKIYLKEVANITDHNSLITVIGQLIKLDSGDTAVEALSIKIY